LASQSRKHRGYASQKIVAEFFAENGFPYAESTGAGRSGSDVTGVLGIDIEVKARRGFPIAETMKQLADRNDGKVQVAVLRLDGTGPKTVQNWPAIVPLSVLVELLRRAGYGNPL
jgi:hypothetical protein